MKRTIENLTQQRRKKEEEFTKKLKTLKRKSEDVKKLQISLDSLNISAQIKELSALPEKNRPLSFLSKSSKGEKPLKLQGNHITTLLSGFHQTLEQNMSLTSELVSTLTDLMDTHTALMDAKDKEWDALGSNHVGQIFKSMEWRVNDLAAAYKDVNLLMKKFLLLKEKLNELLSILEGNKMPSPRLVEDVLLPFEDWQYTGFENRYRGSEDEVKKQLENYIDFFRQEKKVLDLGCGRGEFLTLLSENGITFEGIDINEHMIDICRERDLNCSKADILDKLAESEEESLGGIFSSQVIEHMPPNYLKRVIELAFHKLAPSSYIVLETVNPTSVFALVQIYYLDLSHQKPIHPQALKFLLENVGFEDVEIKLSSELQQEKLQELPSADEGSTILNRNVDKLNKLLYSAPNYAAIGQKK